MSVGRTIKVAGVAGWPIHHSLSPVVHSFWLKKMGIIGAYTHFAVHPKEAIYAFRTLPRTTLSGLNVTLPLKQLAYEAADEATPDAQKLGVANCLYIRDGKLIAHNTDMEGFATPLLARFDARRLASTTAVVIGAGGAAKAVIGALLALGLPEIRVINRTDSRADDLAATINLPSLYAMPWAERNSAVRRAGLIINASAAGMHGRPDLDIDLTDAQDSALAYDLVYTPENTGFLQAAKARGLTTLGGLDMLIAQARPSFKLFYGAIPPMDLDPSDALRAALIEATKYAHD